jgi:hypothetical protein
VYSQIKSWAQRFNHTPIVIDHASKASEGKGGAAFEYGSVFKRARVGASLYLRQAETVDARTTVIDLYNPKSNTVVVDTKKNAPPLVRFSITFDDSECGPIRLDTVGTSNRIDELGDRWVTQEEAAEIWNLSPQRAGRILNAAHRKGSVELRTEKHGQGRPRHCYKRIAASD